MNQNSDSIRNLDSDVAAGFGHEWSTFKQSEAELSPSDRQTIFNSYFRIFPWSELPSNPVGLDIGCGSGRWSAMVAPRVGHLHLLDASNDALEVARENLRGVQNASFHLASVGNIPLSDNSLDFAFSLGVLHHVPDTTAAIRTIATKLRKGAPFLIYLYYAFDNRPGWYIGIWRASNVLRLAISRLSPKMKLAVSQFVALTIYWPLARFASIVERLGLPSTHIPLESYRHRAFYVMRTDAYDRFCTRLEQRFTRKQIEEMLVDAGFDEIYFSDEVPFWVAIARKS
jgi:ubiquinone/menaquinone biosynthesis C-methylase UbiE